MPSPIMTTQYHRRNISLVELEPFLERRRFRTACPRALLEGVDINHEQATMVARHLRKMGVSEVVNPSAAHGFTNYIEMRKLR
jgi:hypothetical protein